MPSVTSVPRVIHQHLQTNTVAGEVTINLHITLTINQDGTIQIAASPAQSPKQTEKQVPDIVHTVPEFEQTDLLTNFGEDGKW